MADGSAPSTTTTTAAAAAAPVSSSGLWQSITERYDSAQRDAAATMTETKTEVVEDGGLQFVLRVAAKLRDKPKAPPAQAQGGAAPKKEWRNPFLPYEQALWVADLGSSHVLLLNKFNIVQHHCLVVTRQFESQLDPLNAADMDATWTVMQSMPQGGLAFYNCGPCSGASQPHKHVQIVPLPLDDSSSSSRDSSSNGSSSSKERPPIWPAVQAAVGSVPAGQPVELHNLPFAAFAAMLAPPQQDGASSSGAYLADVFTQLLGCCTAFVEAKTGQQGVSPQDGSLSYNMVLTSDFMMLVPRRQEAAGPVSCNSVAFGGSIFVRSVEEQQYAIQQGPLHILATTAFPW